MLLIDRNRREKVKLPRMGGVHFSHMTTFEGRITEKLPVTDRYHIFCTCGVSFLYINVLNLRRI